MDEYIMIFNDTNGCDTTPLRVSAINKEQALVKAYSYFGCDSRLLLDDFKIICYESVDRAYHLLKDFSGQELIYFCVAPELSFVDKLTEVDLIEC